MIFGDTTNASGMNTTNYGFSQSVKANWQSMNNNNKINVSVQFFFT